MANLAITPTLLPIGPTQGHVSERSVLLPILHRNAGLVLGALSRPAVGQLWPRGTR